MANREDRDLGMDRPISRRDVLNGIGALAVGTMIPGRALADKVLALERAGEAAAGYPPALTGLRGSHVGSFEVAHQLDLARNIWSGSKVVKSQLGRTIHPPPAYSGGLQPPPSQLEKYCNYLNLLMIT